MKFKLSDFLQLDTKSLFAVNGGSDCSGSSSSYVSFESSSGGNESSGDGGYGGGGSSVTTIYSSHSNSNAASSAGGSCSSFLKNSDGTYKTDFTSTATTKNPVTQPSNPENTSPSVGGLCSGSGGGDTITTVKDKTAYQNPDSLNDYHCDINSYNVAIDNGIENPGTWDGNTLSVNEIYADNYSELSTETPVEGTRGYGFYDNDGDGLYDHMYFYDYTEGGDTYHVWNSNGVDPVSESDWSINGSAVDHSVYVPLE